MVKMKQTAASSQSHPKPPKLYKGVRNQRGKWVSEISLPRTLSVSPKKVWLGSFDTIEEAALAYDTAAFMLHGNSAKLNLPNLSSHAASAADEFTDSCFLENNSNGVSQGLESIHACDPMDENQSIAFQNQESLRKLVYENECLRKEVEVLKEKVELEKVEKMDIQKECSRIRVTYSLRVCALKRHIDYWKQKYLLMGGEIVYDFGGNVNTQEDDHGHEMGQPSNGKVAKKALNGHNITAKKPSGRVLNQLKANKTKRALHPTAMSAKTRTMQLKRKRELQKMKQTAKSALEPGNANANNFEVKRQMQTRKQAKKSIPEDANANVNNISNTFPPPSAFGTCSFPPKPVTLRPCEERTSQQQGSQYHGSGHVVDVFDVDSSEDSSDDSDSDNDSRKYSSSNKYESKARDDRPWEHEVQMLLAFQKDNELCLKAICALYRLHISLGNSVDESKSRGFSKLYVKRGIFLAKFLTHGDPRYKLNKTVDELRAFDYTSVDECRRIAGHHVNQLFEIYEKREDPFFT